MGKYLSQKYKTNSNEREGALLFLGFQAEQVGWLKVHDTEHAACSGGIDSPGQAEYFNANSLRYGIATISDAA